MLINFSESLENRIAHFAKKRRIEIQSKSDEDEEEEDQAA